MKLHYWKFPACFFSEDYASLGTFFPVVCATGSRVLSDNHSVTGESRRITGPFKRATGTGAFSTQNPGNGGDFPRGCAGQFR